MVRPAPDAAAIVGILVARRGPGIGSVVAVDHGEVSPAFFFRQAGRDYVVRCNASPHPFALDRYASVVMAPAVPVPAIVDLWSDGDLWYAISVRLPGQPLSRAKRPFADGLTEALLGIRHRLDALELTAAQGGYGPVAPDGTGASTSWRAHLAGLFGSVASGFWADWEALFTTSFLERPVFGELEAARRALIPCCADAERRVVHGDFHAGNILTDGRTVTGVLDWANLQYGDPVHDLATFALWAPDLGLPALYRASRVQSGREVAHFEQRLLCYTLCVGLDALRFYARTDREPAYRHVRDRLLALVAAG